MKIYIQLDNWQELILYFPSLKYVPKWFRAYVAKKWYKPLAIEWPNGPEIYLLPYINYQEDIDGIVLPQDENSMECKLVWALLPFLLPKLAIHAGINLLEDVLLVVGADEVGDAEFICNLIKPWRFIYLGGQNKLKLRWWKKYTRFEAGQVIQVRNKFDNILPSCVCLFNEEVTINNHDSVRLIIGPKESIQETNNNIYQVTQILIAYQADYPAILKQMYGEFMPAIVVEQLIKQCSWYHKNLSKLLNNLINNVNKVELVAWESDVVWLNIK